MKKRACRPVVDRFAEKVALTESGCLEWIARASDRKGYGRFQAEPGYRGRMVQAHRWMYEWAVGEIPAGLYLDHLCRNPKCVNPEHLEPVTPRENVLRGETWAAAQVLRTHCPQGHPYSGDNLIVYKRMRSCRECKLAYDRRRRARRQVERLQNTDEPTP